MTGTPGRETESGRVERWDPAISSHNLIQAEHEARYWFASSLAHERDVVDVGCGVGYGAAILLWSGATRVVGVDLDAATVEDAAERVGDVTFLEGDARRLPLEDSDFDMAVCFEMIEHVHEGDAVIDELRRILRPDGIAVVSSPNRGVYLPGNPHHFHEYKPEELREALARRFEHVALYRQHSWVTSLVTTDEGMAAQDSYDVLLSRLRKVCAVKPEEETYTVAIASNAMLPDPPSEAVLADMFDPKTWSDRVANLEAHTEGLEAHTEGLEAHTSNLASYARNLETHAQNLETHARNLETHVRNLEGHIAALEGKSGDSAPGQGS